MYNQLTFTTTMSSTITAEEFNAMQGRRAIYELNEITAAQYQKKYVPRHTVLKEHHIQSALVNWFRNNYPGLLLFAIPNGAKLPYKTIKRKGKSVQISPERSKLIEEGLVSGIPDLMLAVAKGEYHGLFIEMKTKDGKVSDSQATIHPILRAQGYAVEVPFGLEAAKEVIIDYLNLP